MKVVQGNVERCRLSCAWLNDGARLEHLSGRSRSRLVRRHLDGWTWTEGRLNRDRVVWTLIDVARGELHRVHELIDQDSLAK